MNTEFITNSPAPNGFQLEMEKNKQCPNEAI